MKRKIILYAFLAFIATSCGTSEKADLITRESQYAAMYAARPVTLLVMPPINNTSYTEAKDMLYTSITQPLAEAGYYVISPFLAMEVLKAESAYDAELFVNGSLEKFNTYFGADAVVFSEIYSWTKIGTGIDTDIRYFIKMTKTGEVVFDRRCDLYLDLSVDVLSGNSALATLINLGASAINTATTSHIEAARKANNFIFRDIPYGKYSPGYDQDREYEAEEQNIKASVK